MSEQNKNFELTEEQLKEITGGSESDEQKFPNGSIFYQYYDVNIYKYYLVYDFMKIGLYKMYKCKEYTVDMVNKTAVLTNDCSTEAETTLANVYISASSIPFLEG